MPGFNDSHLHLADAGQQKLDVDLEGVKSLDELRQRLSAKVQAAKPGEWVVGGGWDESLWPVKALPSRWDLDEVSAGHPVFLDRVDGHLAVANTRALQLANITLASKDPQGGHIDRNETGEPTGILRDTAQAAMRVVIPKATHQKRKQGIEVALADLAEHGVTSAQDNSFWEDFQIYEELEKEGKLTGEGDKGLEGRAFLEGQLVKAGQMLGNIWYTAWLEAPEDQYLEAQLEQRNAANSPSK